MARKIKNKNLINTSLANNYGGWIYCGACKKTVGYLCYVTYQTVLFDYTCKCGNTGSVELEMDDEGQLSNSDESMINIKNRMCCPKDQSPLVTVLSKNLKKYSIEIACTACKHKYREEGISG